MPGDLLNSQATSSVKQQMDVHCTVIVSLTPSFGFCLWKRIRLRKIAVRSAFILYCGNSAVMSGLTGVLSHSYNRPGAGKVV